MHSASRCKTAANQCRSNVLLSSAGFFGICIAVNCEIEQKLFILLPALKVYANLLSSLAVFLKWKHNLPTPVRLHFLCGPSDMFLSCNISLAHGNLRLLSLKSACRLPGLLQLPDVISKDFTNVLFLTIVSGQSYLLAVSYEVVIIFFV